ncbi:MAG: hypothetical protein ACFFAU_11415 [Candidatus Hodarchaeota archaeon]
MKDTIEPAKKKSVLSMMKRMKKVLDRPRSNEDDKLRQLYL